MNWTMNLSLRQLRYVVAAADAGHITDAARRLNVSQPSISSAIAELEAEVGAPLFIRHHARGVTLTPVGERVVNEARACCSNTPKISPRTPLNSAMR